MVSPFCGFPWHGGFLVTPDHPESETHHKNLLTRDLY
jgi:hypothetical protein